MNRIELREIEQNKTSTDCIVVSTVTYNSSHFLRRLVEAVASQSYRVSKIVAVDNASTEEHKKKNRELAIEYPILELIELKDNLGGAGGFEKGIRYIMEQKIPCDWVWIMDDDAFPRQDCLEQLLKHQELESIGALCPLIFGVELKEFQLYHHKKKSRFLNYDMKVVSSVQEMPEIVQIEANAFVGPLVRCNVINEIGVPDGSLFIYGDDTEYMYRISRRFNVYLIKDAVINHRDIIIQEGMIDANRFWKEYYKYRNQMLFVEEYKTSFWQGIIGKTLITKDCIWNILSTLKNRKYKGYRRIRIKCLNMAMRDGYKGRKGKTIDPKSFKQFTHEELMHTKY